MSKPTVTVELFDTTLRDGAQSLPEQNQFSVGSKPTIANRLAANGIQIIEAGFPATPADAEQVLEVANTTGRTVFETNIWSNGKRVDSERRSPLYSWAITY